MNGVGTYAADVSVAGGSLALALPDSTHGALVHTDITGGYRLPVGSCVEARVLFPGSGTTIYNWPATTCGRGRGPDHQLTQPPPPGGGCVVWG
jgi:hypothetical protein